VNRVIRPFACGDRASLVLAINAVCGEGCWMSTQRFEPTPAWSHALIQPGCSRHLLLLVEIQRTIVGWCRLFPPYLCNGVQPEASLGIGLLQPYRDQGIGTSLVQDALGWAVSVGIQVVTLSTQSDNARAIHMFRKCGFRTMGQLPDEQLTMQRRLASYAPGDWDLRRNEL
jgi:RimJ/RimL family protein N-acetyltransferase